MFDGKAIKINQRGAAVFQYLMAFGIPFLVIILAYIGLHITPFGDKTIVLSDAKALYMSDLSYIKRALSGQEGFLYSFQEGIGLNLMGTHSGLLNPANVIVLLFDITAFPSMYSWLMAIDIAVCGLTMFIFLSSVYERKSYNLIFSTVYALIGFNVAYCFHYNFLLSVELLPLIALGIKKIIKGKSPWLYLITLAYTILASFYFGYMVCIASAVLFLMWYAESKKEFIPGQKKRIWINYAGGSLIAGLLPAFMWVASFFSFSGGRAEQNSILDFTMSDNMSFADAFAKLFIGANNTNEIIDGKANIFCGALVVFLIIAFFIDRRNTIRTKVIRAVPIAFYFITFYVKALSMAMQGFTAANWFNYRYSFVFSFLLILTAFEEFIKIRDIETKDFKRSCIVFGIFVAIIFSQNYSYVDGGWMLIDVLILAGCLGAIWWNRIDEKRAPQRVLAMLLILLCSIECYANYSVCTYRLINSTWAYKESEYEEDLFWGSVIADSVTNADQGFYRMVNEHPTNAWCNNDPRLFGYNGVNYFGSCEQTFVFEGMSRLGMNWFSNRMWYSEGLPEAFDSLLGIKYVATDRDLEEEKGYEKLAVLDRYNLYQNSNALPIGMVTSEKINGITLARNPFENYNNIWKALTGLDHDVFTIETDISFTYHANNDGETIDYQTAQQYSTSMSKQIEKDEDTSTSESESEDINSDFASEKETAESIKNSGRYIECIFIAQQDGSIYSYAGAGVQDGYGINDELMRYLGEFKKGDNVTDYIAVNAEQLTMDIMKGISAEYYVGYVNDNVLSTYCNQLQSTAGELRKGPDNYLKGIVHAGEDSRLFFTIPYDEGWTLKVDGFDVELEKTADLFMSASITPGDHLYELRFFPRGMQAGMMMSGAGIILLLLLIGYNILSRRRHGVIKTRESSSSEDDIVKVDEKRLEEDSNTNAHKEEIKEKGDS